MKQRILGLFYLHQSFIAYVFWGVLTTIVNIVVYQTLFSVLQFSNMFSNGSAWVLSVLFAFYTNRKWVFKSTANTVPEVFREMTAFILCRLSTGGFDMAFMFISVDLLMAPALPAKAISNIIVILLNYIASKLLIFRG